VGGLVEDVVQATFKKDGAVWFEVRHPLPMLVCDHYVHRRFGRFVSFPELGQTIVPRLPE
jgi:hypothetical protein